MSSNHSNGAPSLQLPSRSLPDGLLQPTQWRVASSGMTARDPSGAATTFAYMHMGMVAELPDERLVLAFQASAALEAAEDQRVWYMVSEDTAGKVWGSARPLLPAARNAAQWAPVLHWSVARRRLYLFYAESHPRCLRAKGKGGQPRRYAVGGDIRMTWADVPASGEDADIMWRGPSFVYRQRDGDKPTPKVIANRMLELSTGEWVLPFWRQRSYQVCETKGGVNAAGVLLSADDGETWTASGELTLPHPADHWVIEGAALELANGTLLLMLRSTEGFIYRSMSADKGHTWGAVSPTPLRNPDAKVHAIRLPGPDANLALAYNDHDRPFHGMAKGRGGAEGKRRDTLMLAVSPDSGHSWKQVARLDPPASVTWQGHPAHGVNLMSHYPTMLPRQSGTLLIAYSRAYYPDRSTVDPPLLDGIWLAEVPPEVLQP